MLRLNFAVPCLLAISLPATMSAAQDEFVDVSKFIPGIVLDLRYATENNFTHHKVYNHAVCLLRRSTAEKLAAVQKGLRTEGLGLKLFDCYRPLSVQKKFWALVPDERYVANPAKGSRHNRGAALDLTLVRLTNSKQLDMGTEFDDFTERAHRDYNSLSPDARANRKKLEDAMARHGFIGMPTEWWHFDDRDWEQYPVADMPMKSTVNPR